MLSDAIKYYNETGKSKVNTPASYKTEFKWLQDVYSLALSNAQLNLKAAYANFFREIKNGNKNQGYPKFKNKKTNFNCYTTNNQNGTIYIKNGYIKLPKLKTMIMIKQHRQIPLDGIIKSCTVSKEPSNRYYISILVEQIIHKLKKTGQSLSITKGVKDFAICSNGITFEIPKYLKTSKAKLSKLQRVLAKKVKRSKNRRKTRIKVARLREKIKNQEKDYLHKISTQLIRENQSIAVENLNPKVTEKRKTISEVSWSMFISMLEYKSKWYGREIVKVDTCFISN